MEINKSFFDRSYPVTSARRTREGNFYGRISSGSALSNSRKKQASSPGAGGLRAARGGRRDH
eukprot:624565-Prymnesium_polylepis.1